MAAEQFTSEDFADLDVSRMAVAVTDAYFEAHPEMGMDVQQKLRGKCHQDVECHFQFLQAALLHSSKEIFEQYIAWLKEVFASHNLPLSHLEESLELIAQYLDRHLKPVLSEAAGEVIRIGLDQLSKLGALVQPESSSRALVLPGAQAYTEALLLGSQQRAGQVVLLAMEQGHKLVDAGVGIVQPAMYEVGHLWLSGRVTVAQEHLATAISQTILARGLMNEEYAESNGRKALFACVAGNHHMLGLRVVSDAFEVAGWEVDFLGADTPTDAIMQLVDERKPDMVGLSVSMPVQMTELSCLVTQIKAKFAASRPVIVVGGLVFNSYPSLRQGIGADEWFADAKQAVEGM
ncbi:cobalamin B12-binding domain-containing protein [Solemya velesiana gill symbiont]|uniref:B12-binding domain-containing protein n=1 Tax=Solemya velesiana gill symbiont TaxID=1918948 RepID=A0A1T2KMT1_9GAMM|nr:cobalamin-dependent protein [Solemya velesiana gill symbiont]OOZ34145.1 hypothetical protein BOW51_12305 [Solemya velesiana gill symbiont]